jgi:hypothetical protein
MAKRASRVRKQAVSHAIIRIAMDTAFLLFRLLPAFTMVAYGTYSVLEVFFPSLRDPDFNRWEVDSDTGSSIEILGWKRVLTPPRVIAQGYLSDKTACAVSLTFGIVLIVVGFLIIRHIAGIPESFPDWFDRFSK